MHGEERIEIRVQDGQRVLVGEDLGEIAAQLRARYPDGRFERFLRMQRDKDAELKYKAALDELAMVFVRAAVDDLLREEFASPHESLLGKNSSI